MADKEKKLDTLDDLMSGDVKSIDPTKIGGLDGSRNNVPTISPDDILNESKSNGSSKK